MVIFLSKCSNKCVIHHSYKEYCMSLKSVIMQPNYCLKFLPKKEYDSWKSKHNIYEESCMSFKSIIVQSHYYLNFLPKKEHDRPKPNIKKQGCSQPQVCIIFIQSREPSCQRKSSPLLWLMLQTAVWIFEEQTQNIKQLIFMLRSKFEKKWDISIQWIDP